MENEFKEIDNIIKDKLLDYQDEVSPMFWNRLYGRLLRKRSGIILLIVLLIGLILLMVIPWQTVGFATDNVVSESQFGFSNKAKTESIINDEIIIASDPKLEIPSVIISDSHSENINMTNYRKLVSEIIDENLQGEVVETNSIESGDVKIRDDYSSVSQITQIRTSVLSEYENPSFINNNYNQQNKGFQFKRNKGGRFSISMEIGYNISWKSLSSDPGFDNYKKYREDNEKPTSNLAYGIRFNYQYKNWILSTGVDYTTIGEELNYNINSTIIDPDAGYYNTDTIWAIMSNDEFILKRIIIGYDRTWVDEYKDVNYMIDDVNRYSYIEIPISVGYKFNIQKFSIIPSSGVSLGFLYDAKGKLPVMNSEGFVEFDKESGYLNHSVTNINFDLQLEYYITPNYGIYIKPYYKQGLKSVYKNYPLSGKYKSTGVKFGIVVYLN